MHFLHRGRERGSLALALLLRQDRGEPAALVAARHTGGRLLLLVAAGFGPREAFEAGATNRPHLGALAPDPAAAVDEDACGGLGSGERAVRLGFVAASRARPRLVTLPGCRPRVAAA